MHNIFIISGPSGAGEDSIIDGLAQLLPIEKDISTTTRPMRPGETNGHPYYFITKAEFERRIKLGDFIEYAETYNGHYYGVTKKEIERLRNSGKIGIWKIDYKGTRTAKKLFPDITAIFINAPLHILEKRIRSRDNASEEYVAKRMAYTKEWLKHTDIYDYTIENEQGKLNETIQKVSAIIKKHASL